MQCNNLSDEKKSNFKNFFIYFYNYTKIEEFK